MTEQCTRCKAVLYNSARPLQRATGAMVQVWDSKAHTDAPPAREFVLCDSCTRALLEFVHIERGGKE